MWPFKKPSPYVKQAKEDQKKADYPGCMLGLMQCRSQSCGCNGSQSCGGFVKERAKALQQQAECKHPEFWDYPQFIYDDKTIVRIERCKTCVYGRVLDGTEAVL
jgi:hypothetical protein